MGGRCENRLGGTAVLKIEGSDSLYYVILFADVSRELRLMGSPVQIHYFITWVRHS